VSGRESFRSGLGKELILGHCAQRFDGYKGRDDKKLFATEEALECFFSTGRWPEVHEEQVAAFFGL
jgi:hypothetical protein